MINAVIGKRNKLTFWCRWQLLPGKKDGSILQGSREGPCQNSCKTDQLRQCLGGINENQPQEHTHTYLYRGKAKPVTESGTCMTWKKLNQEKIYELGAADR